MKWVIVTVAGTNYTHVVCVIHGHSDAWTFEVINVHRSFLSTILRGINELQFPWTWGDEIS